jgi:hypothetical protein
MEGPSLKIESKDESRVLDEVEVFDEIKEESCFDNSVDQMGNLFVFPLIKCKVSVKR